MYGLGAAEEVRSRGVFVSDHVALCPLCGCGGRNFHSHRNISVAKQLRTVQSIEEKPVML